MIPIGQASTAGNLTFKSTATIVAKEGISMGAGAGAQKITTDVTGNDTAGMVAGMFASGVTAKGLNGIEAEANKLAKAPKGIDGVTEEAGNLAEDVGKAGKGLEGAAKGAESAAEDAGKVVESGSGSAIPDSVDIRLNSLVDEIRTDIGKEYPVGNVGAAITDIEGVTSEIKAYSKINNSISSPNINHEYSYNLGSNNRIFETVDVNSQNIVNGPKAFNRCIDTESKILEDIAHQLGYNTFAVDESVVGNVYLITERAPCPSCESVIAQFKEMFPNVNVEVKYMY